MPNVIVKAGVKDELDDMNISAGVYHRLDVLVREELQDARDRARANGRKTVKADDL